SPETIEKAREIDLLSYLKACEPYELVYNGGGEYSTKTHDSLKISNGKWYWWSRGFGGYSALDYLTKVKGLPLIKAMDILTDDSKDFQFETPRIFNRDNSSTERKLLLPEKCETNLEVIRYLSSRGIDREIIKDCINEGLLYESLPYHNCIFVGYDESGTAAYACYRATNGERIMGDAAGSEKRYAFRVESKGGSSGVLHTFESAVDLLSFATIMKMQTGNWRAEPMLSLGGVYAPSPNRPNMKIPAALDNALQNHPEVKTIALHLDNDYAGRSAAKSIAEQLQDRYEIRNEPPPSGKDCNDFLMIIRQRNRSRQMGAAGYEHPR
ncbi:MAG: DUF3991 and TOPRIM domain-containing protein, partial [Mogibacterium sp.]|nr:DUF3991 and TOPRIM domain-containing protein [Mogibacterium sp.]